MDGKLLERHSDGVTFSSKKHSILININACIHCYKRHDFYCYKKYLFGFELEAFELQNTSEDNDEAYLQSVK